MRRIRGYVFAAEVEGTDCSSLFGERTDSKAGENPYQDFGSSNFTPYETLKQVLEGARSCVKGRLDVRECTPAEIEMLVAEDVNEFPRLKGKSSLVAIYEGEFGGKQLIGPAVEGRPPGTGCSGSLLAYNGFVAFSRIGSFSAYDGATSILAQWLRKSGRGKSAQLAQFKIKFLPKKRVVKKSA